MPAADVITVQPQREMADCATAAMAMYAGVSYEDALRAVAVIDPDQGREGLTDHQVRKAMETLGVPVRFTSKADLSESYGMLRLTDHLVVLRNGLVIDDARVWELEDYLAAHGRGPGSILGLFLAKE